ncbi:MAG: STM4504/CBY_0614 family protein [Cytophagales bacterium]
MAIIDLFSKRQKRLRGEFSDIYIYDNIPAKFRVQIVHIIKDAIGIDRYGCQNAQKAWEFIKDVLCREYGLFELGNGYRESNRDQVLNFFLQTKNTDEVIDVIEISFKYIDRIIKKSFQEYTYQTEIYIKPDEAILELNERFKENSIGYSFDGSEIIRVDSTYAHSEITKPTIALLRNNKFKGANEEYLKAHEHYRHGRNKECLSECLKAFESTMKIICKEKGWIYNQTDTANKLIQICFQNGLIPTFTQNQFTSLQNLLVSGIPTIRNKLGGHGQGQTPQIVDDEITRYGLNLSGTNIIFLIEQSKIK